MLSIVVPVFNERESLKPLVEAIEDTHPMLGRDVELVLVDDGSTDGSWDIISELCAEEYTIRCLGVKLRRNYGKASALDAGFKQASGDVIVSMDGDLQDDPAEIPKLLEKLQEGDYDLVSGWKQNRQDTLEKILPSRVFNWATRLVTGTTLHDYNCGLKAYRRRAIIDLHLYGDLHRYTPVLLQDRGFRIAEVKVGHRPRIYGKSKYGFRRYFKGLLDLLSVLAITRFSHRPGHLFGGIGLMLGIFGILILSYLTVQWFVGMRPLGTRPLFFLGILLVIVSGQLISLGLLGELLLAQQVRRNPLDLVKTVIASDSDKPSVK